MLAYYQELWEIIWLPIFIEGILDGISIYALFRPFSGILKVFNRINWAEAIYGVLFAYVANASGGFTASDNFLIGLAPLTFSVVTALIS